MQTRCRHGLSSWPVVRACGRTGLPVTTPEGRTLSGTSGTVVDHERDTGHVPDADG
ncbi:hypothetical protein [Streptomyces sp. ZEA17I]|uniref:hypothetical protein n=1 Tax=Streptomyces sp. ZEA17I TaxID=2202516 RepID=UPI0015E85F71|nr:hypothetical protein [Streptomyces sp. ZEA17I]